MHVALVCADNDTWAIGMRSISAALRDAGHTPSLIFAGSANLRMLQSVKSLCTHADLVGISSMSRGSRNAKEIIDFLKGLGKPIVWGGMHPTLYPEDCVGHADLVCRGEGEEFMVELANRISSGRGYKDIRNGAYLENGRMVANAVRPPIDDMDRLPTPDFTFCQEYRIGRQGEIRPDTEMKKSAEILFNGSRGCLYNCHYCSNAQLRALYAGSGRLGRKMSISRFIDSVDACRRQFPEARQFYFTDEDFFARPVDEFRQLADEYPKRIGVPFECMASPQQVTEEKVALLVKAGMWRVDVGVESGSDRIKREYFNRPVSNDTVMKAAGIISRHPTVVAYYFFIIGNPYDAREDLLATIDLVSRLPVPFFLRTYSLVFIPGTQLFERACKDGIIHGISDSGFELDFLSGYDYRSHPWKRKNLYLNGVMSLMTGKAKRGRLGFVPRRLLPRLTTPRWIDFNDRHPALSKLIIFMARKGLVVRRAILVLATRVLKSPGSVHNILGRLRRGRKSG